MVYYLSLNRRLRLVALAITLLLAWLGLIVILLAYISVYKLWLYTVSIKNPYPLTNC